MEWLELEGMTYIGKYSNFEDKVARKCANSFFLNVHPPRVGFDVIQSALLLWTFLPFQTLLK